MSFKTVPQMFQHLVSEKPTLKTFYTKTENGWEGVELANLQVMVEDFANGLKNLGINDNDKVAIIGANSRKWAISDYAIAHIRAVSVPVYPTLIPTQSQYVVEHSESKIAIVQDEVQLDKVYPLINDANSNLNTIIIMDDEYSGGKEHVINFGDVFNMKDQVHDIRALSATVQENDLLTLIYTSGTTGNPKGVMLSHANICNNLLSIDVNIKAAMELNPELKPADGIERFVSFLPISHSFERVGGHYSIFSQGTSIYYAEMNFTPEILFENIREVRPTFLTAVPRIFEKIHAKILDSVASMTGIKKKLADWSISVGLQTVPYRTTNRDLPFVLGLKYKIADKLVLNKFRAALGGKVRACSSGGSALSKEVGSFFCGIGISIIEGYGLTETSPVMTIGHPDFFKFGTVGKAMPDTDIKITEQGEITMKNDCIMQGYFKEDKLTNETIKNGYLHTGDKGVIDNDGYLTITGRIKDIFKTAKGKYVAPNPIELKLSKNSFIEQVCVVGDNLTQPIALVILSEGKKIVSEIKSSFEELIVSINDQLEQHEKIKKIVILKDSWSIENNILTPTLKIKRNIVDEKYKKFYETWFDSENKIVFQ